MSSTSDSQDSSAEAVPVNSPSDLQEPRWSVVSFEKLEAAGRPFADAFSILEELEAKGIAGLCLVTDEAAARIPKN